MLVVPSVLMRWHNIEGNYLVAIVSKLELKVSVGQRAHVQLRIAKDLARVEGTPSFRSSPLPEGPVCLGPRGVWHMASSGGADWACILGYEGR